MFSGRAALVSSIPYLFRWWIALGSSITTPTSATASCRPTRKGSSRITCRHVTPARYDRVVHDGVQVFRSLPQLTPAPDFQLRLMGRLYARERAEARGSGTSVAVTLAICLALSVGAWAPTLRSSDDVIQLPPIVAHAPYHDFSPVLLRSAHPMRPQLFSPQPVFYGGETLFSPRPTLTMFTTTSQPPAPTFLLQR